MIPLVLFTFYATAAITYCIYQYTLLHHSGFFFLSCWVLLLSTVVLSMTFFVSQKVLLRRTVSAGACVLVEGLSVVLSRWSAFYAVAILVSYYEYYYRYCCLYTSEYGIFFAAWENTTVPGMNTSILRSIYTLPCPTIIKKKKKSFGFSVRMTSATQGVHTDILCCCLLLCFSYIYFMAHRKKMCISVAVDEYS